MCLCDAGRVFEANKITPSINRDNTNSFFYMEIQEQMFI